MNQKVDIAFNSDSTSGLLTGVEKLAAAVRTTMGPGGSNVLIETNSHPILTKDGVTVAKAINLVDKLESTSRLCCQIDMTKDIDGLKIIIPEEN